MAKSSGIKGSRANRDAAAIAADVDAGDYRIETGANISGDFSTGVDQDSDGNAIAPAGLKILKKRGAAAYRRREALMNDVTASEIRIFEDHDAATRAGVVESLIKAGEHIPLGSTTQGNSGAAFQPVQNKPK